MNITNCALRVAILAGSMMVISGAQANTVITQYFAGGNDCSGFFGKPFDECNVSVVDSSGTTQYLSPVIAKFDESLLVEDTNETLYTSIDGTEWSFSNEVDNGTDTNIAGHWAYSPGTNDPSIRYWAAKSGTGFNLFWTVNDSAVSVGGACENAANYNTYQCLNSAIVTTSGSWVTPDNKSLSHITFYDTGAKPPSEIPVPAAVWLFGSGLFGMVVVARRKKATRAA